MGSHYCAKERRKLIISLLMERGPMLASELVRATGYCRQTLVHHLDILVERGQIHRYPKPHQWYSICPPPARRTLAEIYDSLSS
jgi:DNA-binding transcriptional ArsR family regulator